MISRFHIALLTVGGLGLLRPAPGTIGSLPPVALALILVSAVNADRIELVTLTLVAVCIAASIICIWLGERAERAFGRKDASQIVIDEVAGQSIALLALPWRAMDQEGWRWNLLLAATAFFAFRAMDILKPPPAHSLQRLQGGWGVLIDDLIAGVYALVITQLLVRFVY